MPCGGNRRKHEGYPCITGKPVGHGKGRRTRARAGRAGAAPFRPAMEKQALSGPAMGAGYLARLLRKAGTGGQSGESRLLWGGGRSGEHRKGERRWGGLSTGRGARGEHRKARGKVGRGREPERGGVQERAGVPHGPMHGGVRFFLSLYKRSLLCAGPMHGVIQKRGRSVRHLPGAQGRLRARKKPCAAALLFRGHCRGFCTFRALGGGTPQGAFPTGHRRLHFGHAQGFYAQDHVCLCAGRRTEKTRELCSKSPRSRAMEGPCSRAGVLLVDLHGKQPEAYDKSHKNGANTQYQSSKFHTILLGFVQDKRRRTSWNGASVIVCILI